jgi:hypothetical protein
MDFWRRVRAAGGRLYLDPSIRARYVAHGEIGAAWKHNFSDGYWVTRPLRLVGSRFSMRHFAPLAFLVAISTAGLAAPFIPLAFRVLQVLLAAYSTALFAASALRAIQTHDGVLPLTGPIAFGARHFGYALGSLWGMTRPVDVRNDSP